MKQIDVRLLMLLKKLSHSTYREHSILWLSIMERLSLSDFVVV